MVIPLYAFFASLRAVLLQRFINLPRAAALGLILTRRFLHARCIQSGSLRDPARLIRSYSSAGEESAQP